MEASSKLPSPTNLYIINTATHRDLHQPCNLAILEKTQEGDSNNASKKGNETHLRTYKGFAKSYPPTKELDLVIDLTAHVNQRHKEKSSVSPQV
jgi:hypothetical protein